MDTLIGFFTQLWERLLPYLRNKYLLTIIFVVVWLTFFDRNNFIDRVSLIRESHQLKNDCEYYREKIVNDSARLVELHSSPEMLEKYAREQYLMKKDNEDIFVIVDH
ncbi:MAG: septum formation initiator family protein [Bacteroidales bacterium]|nr:septum formation initiator family protein [Bacteroidales bacterium]